MVVGLMLSGRSQLGWPAGYYRFAMKLLSGLVLAVAAAGCAATGGGETLVVASDFDNIPFAYVDEYGRPGGRDVEMMEALAEDLGARLEWRRMPFEELIPAVEAGEVDVVCATLGVSRERAERVAFTRPYFRTWIAVVVRAGPDEPGTLEDLADRRVAAGAGTTSAQAVLWELPEAALALENAKDLSMIERLLAGDVDAAALDGPAADAIVAESAGRLARLEENLDLELYALALPLDRGDLLERLNAVLATMERSGRMQELDARFGLASLQ